MCVPIKIYEIINYKLVQIIRMLLFFNPSYVGGGADSAPTCRFLVFSSEIINATYDETLPTFIFRSARTSCIDYVSDVNANYVSDANASERSAPLPF